jgi:hypothetical protein
MAFGNVMIALQSQLQRLRHPFRPRLGDSSKRAECCGQSPSEYPGVNLARLPELTAKVEKVSELVDTYSVWYACRVCGQEWVEQFEGYPKEAPTVRKAI